MRFQRSLSGAALVALLASSLPGDASAQQDAKRRAERLQRQQQQSAVPEKQFPVGAVWLLRSMGGKAPPAGVEATLRIDSNYRGTGRSGCNTFSATLYPTRGQRMAMGPVALTRKQCPAPIMMFERAYLTALHSSPSWDTIGDELVVKSRLGELRFRRSL